MRYTTHSHAAAILVIAFTFLLGPALGATNNVAKGSCNSFETTI